MIFDIELAQLQRNPLLLFIETHKVSCPDLILEICALRDALGEFQVIYASFQRNEFQEDIPVGGHRWIESAKFRQRPKGLGTVDDRETTCFKPLVLGVCPIKIVHFQPLTVRCKAVIEVKEMLWLIRQGGDNPRVDLRCADIMANIRGNELFAMSPVKRNGIRQLHQSVHGFVGCIDPSRIVNRKFNFADADPLIGAGQPVTDRG